MAIEEQLLIKLQADVAGYNKAINSAAGNTEKAQKKMETSFNKVSQAVNQATVNSNKAGKALGGMGRKAGQAGIQIQQMVGQVQGGVDPFIALSQQGADLGIVLGAPLVGAIVGIGAALLGTLVPSMLEAGSSIEEVTKQLEELRKESLLTAAQELFLSEQKQKSNRETRIQIRENNELISSLEREIETYESLAENVGQASDSQLQRIQSLPELREELSQVRAETDLLTQSLDDNSGKYKEAIKLEKELQQSLETRSLASAISGQTTDEGISIGSDDPMIQNIRDREALKLAELQVQFEKEKELLTIHRDSLAAIEGDKSQEQLDAQKMNYEALLELDNNFYKDQRKIKKTLTHKRVELIR